MAPNAEGKKFSVFGNLKNGVFFGLGRSRKKSKNKTPTNKTKLTDFVPGLMTEFLHHRFGYQLLSHWVSGLMHMNTQFPFVTLWEQETRFMLKKTKRSQKENLQPLLRQQKKLPKPAVGRRPPGRPRRPAQPRTRNSAPPPSPRRARGPLCVVGGSLLSTLG